MQVARGNTEPDVYDGLKEYCVKLFGGGDFIHNCLLFRSATKYHIQS